MPLTPSSMLWERCALATDGTEMELNNQHVALIRGAVAIEFITRCAEGFSTIVVDYPCASALKQLIHDADYRVACLETHAELFSANDAPEKLAAVVEEVRKWKIEQFRKESLSALGTAGTPPTSKEKPTSP